MQAEAFAIWSSSSCSCPACSPILCWEQLCSSPARAHREALSSRAQHSQKLSTPFCPAALTARGISAPRKVFGVFPPWLCCRRAVGSFFSPDFPCRAHQCLGLGRAAPGATQKAAWTPRAGPGSAPCAERAKPAGRAFPSPVA